MRKRITLIACLLLAFAAVVSAQPVQLSVTVGPEAALTIGTGTTLTTTATDFSKPFTGTTSFTYFIRTSKTSGSGAITTKVTSDFGPGGPSAAAGNLSYTCTASAPATAACTTPVTSLTTAATNVATFGTGVNSAKAGNSGTVVWSLVDDPAYGTGAYTATVTFVISAS